MVEIAWLVVVNSLLYWPLTQTVINGIRPEKFQVHWGSAWSWYPGRIRVEDALANGNAARQMWQVEVESVSGSVAFLPLLLKRVWISDVSGLNVEFRQRPRPRADRDYSRIERFFPEIDGREVTPALPLPQRRWPWRVAVDDMRIAGKLDYWIYQLRGSAEGSGRVDLAYRSSGGPLELDVSEIDLALGPHWIEGDRQVFPQGQITGTLGFVPFRPRENRGWTMLRYLVANLDLDIELDNLKFINAFLLNFPDITVDGHGQVSGQLNFAQGTVLPGTDLSVQAGHLELDAQGYRIDGEGEVKLSMGPATGGNMDLVFDYGALEVVPPGENAPMLTGDGLLIKVGGDGNVLPRAEGFNPSREVGLEIGRLAVPDLASYQRFLPKKWPVTLLGGSGTLEGSASLTPDAYSVDLELTSDEAEIESAGYRFETDLETALKVRNPAVTAGGSRLDGSYLRLSDARLAGDGGQDAESWSASLEINEANYRLLGPVYEEVPGISLDLFRVLAETDLKELLGQSRGRFDFEARVSSLAWLALFLGDNYRAGAEGNARIAGTAALDAGLPAPGTDIVITSDELGFKLLDYAAVGEGAIQLTIEEGGDAPDWLFDAKLWNAGMRRRADQDFFLQDVTMSLAAEIVDVSLQRESTHEFSLDFRIPTARLVDMAVLNAHLPPDSPLRFDGGEADVNAEIVLHPEDARGWLNLVSKDVAIEASEQSLRADLDVRVNLAGGVPRDMIFDLAESELSLGSVRVAGENQAFEDAHWSALLTLTRGKTVFTRPLALDVEAHLSASDSRPFVALFRNQEGWRPRFLAEAMTVEDISGSGTLTLRDRRLVVPGAWLSSDNIRAGVKGMLEPGGNEGRIYLEYGKLGLLLKLTNGKRNIDIIRPKAKYDAYLAPE